MPPHPAADKALRLPPGFQARSAHAPWLSALAAAAADEAPGLVLHDLAGGLVDAALILVPDRPVEHATVLRLGLLAVLDVLTVIVPPETGVSVVGESVAVNGGAVATVAVARGASDADGTPAWLVLGFRIRVALALEAPGLTPWLTDLAEEGIDVDPAALLEALCRHLLAGIDLWQAEGQPGIDQAWRVWDQASAQRAA